MALKLAPKPSRVPISTLIYGLEGIGKTTFAASAPKPVFIQTENGLTALPNVERFPLATDYDAVMSQLEELRKEAHDFQTLCIDSLDWFERLLWSKCCEDYRCNSLEEVLGGYGKGPGVALNYWRTFFQSLDALKSERGMSVILIAHHATSKVENPDGSNYTRFAPRLEQKHAEPIVKEWVDCMLFAHVPLVLAKMEQKGKDNRHVAKQGAAGRILRCVGTPTCSAKNRFGIPEIIPLDYAEYAKYLPKTSGAGVKAEKPSTSPVALNAPAPVSLPLPKTSGAGAVPAKAGPSVSSKPAPENLGASMQADLDFDMSAALHAAMSRRKYTLEQTICEYLEPFNVASIEDLSFLDAQKLRERLQAEEKEAKK